MVLRSGIVIDSRRVTSAFVPSPSPVPEISVAPMPWCEGRGNITSGLRPEEMESGDDKSPDKNKEDLRSEGADRETHNVEANSAEIEDEAPFVFPERAPAPDHVADPVGRAAKSPSLTLATTSEGTFASPVPRPAVKSVGSGVSSSSGVGHGGSGKAIPPPLFGGREDVRLEWTAKGPPGIIEGRTRGDARRLQTRRGL